MLAAERCNPEIIRGNRLAFLFQLRANGRVGVSGLIVNVEHTYCSDPFSEPVLVGRSVPRLRYSKPVLAQDNHGNRKAFGAGDNL